MEVTSSGSDVPNATIVSPIRRESTPIASAIFVAPVTVKSLPNTIITSPRRMKIIIFSTVSFSVSGATSSSPPPSPFFARKIR